MILKLIWYIIFIKSRLTLKACGREDYLRYRRDKCIYNNSRNTVNWIQLLITLLWTQFSVAHLLQELTPRRPCPEDVLGTRRGDCPIHGVVRTSPFSRMSFRCTGRVQCHPMFPQPIGCRSHSIASTLLSRRGVRDKPGAATVPFRARSLLLSRSPLLPHLSPLAHGTWWTLVLRRRALSRSGVLP